VLPQIASANVIAMTESESAIPWREFQLADPRSLSRQ
jgi:hypothetical protein